MNQQGPLLGMELGRMLTGQVHSPVVYFVRLGNGLVKIGTTTRLRERMSSLYVDLSDVLLVFPGGRKTEQGFHGRFAEYRADTPFREELFEVRGRLELFLWASTYHPGKRGKDLAHWASGLGVKPEAEPDVLGLSYHVREIVYDFTADLGELEYLARRMTVLDAETAEMQATYLLKSGEACRHTARRALYERGTPWRCCLDFATWRHERRYARRWRKAHDIFTQALRTA